MKRPARSAPTSVHDGAPAVCRSGMFQFAPNQKFSNGCVESRGLFWCKTGHGRFEVDGQLFEIGPNDLYVLPWGRRITYRPSSDAPMFTVHVHLVPWYRFGSPWVPNVPHEPNEPEFGSADRRDVALPNLNGVTRLRLGSEEPLSRLMDYTARWYQESSRDEAEARALGLLLLREVIRKARNLSTPALPFPEELQRLVTHIDRGFHLGPRIAELANLIGRSRSHVLKLFRRFVGMSAKRYVIERQLKAARELLLSTTLPVSEVGRSVGLTDPYHFSKLFCLHVGLSPRDFRLKHGPFPSRPKTSRHQSQTPRAKH